STPSLNALMDAVAKPGNAGARDSVLPVRRPSGKRPLTAVVRAVEETPANGDAMAPATLLFILDPEIPLETVEAELRQLYGLTSTEACLANLLMEGKALDECCALLSIRRSTARTHLQHLFEKLGVQRQSELVSLLLKSIGLVGPANKKGKTQARVMRSNDYFLLLHSSGQKPQKPITQLGALMIFRMFITNSHEKICDLSARRMTKCTR